MPPSYPLINGHRYDWSSVVIKLGGIQYSGVRAINYKHSVDPGKLRGNRAQIIGATRGEYNAEGNIEIYLQEYDELTSQLVKNGKGYFEQFFEMTVSYSEPESTPVTDYLRGVRLSSSEKSGSEGSDPLFVRCDLLIMYLLENGKTPLTFPGQMLK
jgi:hypothetical protein